MLLSTLLFEGSKRKERERKNNTTNNNNKNYFPMIFRPYPQNLTTTGLSPCTPIPHHLTHITATLNVGQLPRNMPSLSPYLYIQTQSILLKGMHLSYSCHIGEFGKHVIGKTAVCKNENNKKQTKPVYMHTIIGPPGISVQPVSS